MAAGCFDRLVVRLPLVALGVWGGGAAAAAGGARLSIGLFDPATGAVSMAPVGSWLLPGLGPGMAATGAAGVAVPAAVGGMEAR